MSNHDDYLNPDRHDPALQGEQMRKITSHVVNPANDKLEITVLDEPGSGWACHNYLIHGYDPTTNPDNEDESEGANLGATWLLFQNGPIEEVGVNGITPEALLAVLIDLLQGFQAGPYACRETALALTHLQDAHHWLAHRTRARMARGVEGTHKV
jgi:hypothetical protein